MYKNDLLYVNQIIRQVSEINSGAREYFHKLKHDNGYKTAMYHASQVKIDAKENLKVNYYHEVFKAQMNELKSLQELHDKNWLELKEIIEVGHSELEQSRKKNREGNNWEKRFLSLAAGIFSGFA